MKEIESSIKKVWSVQYGLFGSVLVIFLALYDVSIWFQQAEDRLLPIGVLTLVGSIGTIVITVFVPGIRYRQWAYELRDEEFEVRRGVLTRVVTLVPLRRIQHIDVSQNILEREFDISRLIIYTAGTQGNRVVVLGLPKSTAEELRDTMKRFVLEEVGQ